MLGVVPESSNSQFATMDTELTHCSMANKRRKKEDDDDTGDVTYINKRNKHFNKKVARYFDKYTKEYVSAGVSWRVALADA